MSDIKNWSETAASNNAAAPNGFPEGMAPSGVNDACREVMAAVRRWVDDSGWHNWGYTYTYVSGTSVSVPTDLTTIHHAGRRIRAVGSGTGTIYGTIASSTYGAPNTTIVIVWDSGSLTSEALTVSIGYLGAINSAVSAVLLSGAQVVAGIKTFSSFPITPSSAPTTDYQASNKKYVDDIAVALTGNQTVAGVKTFSSFPVTPSAAPTTDYQVVNKAYADSTRNFPISGAYENLGTSPATELGYGTWTQLLSYVQFMRLFPWASTADYVKSTSDHAGTERYYCTDPSKSLTGAESGNQWDASTYTNQRLHIDFGSPITPVRIYYENGHTSGTNVTAGSKNFTLWGSNDPRAFADLTYATDTYWTQIGGAMQFEQHTGSDIADPKYITLTGASGCYRYWAIKIADNWAGSNLITLRRISLEVTQLAKWIRTA